MIPLTLVPEVLNLCHDSPTVSHQGFTKTLKSIESSFYWPKLYKHVMNHLKTCHFCNEKKAHKRNELAPFQRIAVTSKPMECIAIDALGPLPINYSGNK